MRHAIVTGAASGIGAAAASALKRDGFRVTGLDRNDPGDRVDAWLSCDLDASDIPLPSLDAPVDVLVNAAGLPPRPETEARVLRVNFLALRRVTAHVIPRMNSGGSFVNLASKAGARWRENIAEVRALMSEPDDASLDEFVATHGIDPVRSYDLSKEAVIAWTKHRTGPLIQRGLRMNAVSPAAVETPILQDFKRAFGDRATRGIALTDRPGTPAEIADVIAFLANPTSGWLRGCNIECDGGLTAILETERLMSEPK